MTAAAVAVGLWLVEESTSAPAPMRIEISPVVPKDIPGGAGNADLKTAATFAWQEFIALNWPAVKQPGKRDTPDTRVKFGDPSHQGPLVWETYRSKVEIFPGSGKAPPGYNRKAKDFGYDASPQYNYLADVPPCDGKPVPAPQTAWVNLDEVTQIGLDDIYAGRLPADQTPVNRDPPLLRFLAKANRTQYVYVAGNSYWNFGGNFYDAVANFTNAIKTKKVPDEKENPIISFPAGTIEVKAAWRLLAADEDTSRFHTATVRYYENLDPNGDSLEPTPCYRQAAAGTWGLIALHIIQKTPSAPYFTFATFEQADNLLTADGKPVEDENGKVINPPGGKATFPDLKYKDGYDQKTQSPDPRLAAVPPNRFCSTDSQDPHFAGRRLYYRNLQRGLPISKDKDGVICVNQRYNPIPPDVVAVNQAAHAAIERHQKGSPWQFYKLVNIQWQPFDVSEIDASDPNGPRNPATFYQANSVVETNNTLQEFRGALIGTGASQGLKTSFSSDGKKDFKNVYVANGKTYKSYNMGGCMGCHGNAQVAGTDFSFILNFGPVPFPEYPDPEDDGRLAKRYFAGLPH